MGYQYGSIANINADVNADADGTFTHVVVEEDDDDDIKLISLNNKEVHFHFVGPHLFDCKKSLVSSWVPMAMMVYFLKVILNVEISRRDLFLGLWSISRISISQEDRRPKLLETGAVGRVQGYKRDQQESVLVHAILINTVLLLLLLATFWQKSCKNGTTSI